MTWFKSTGQLPTDFKEAAFALQNNGDYTAPVKTDFGWHIIKRLEIKPVAPLTEQKENLKYKVSRRLFTNKQQSGFGTLEKRKQIYSL